MRRYVIERQYLMPVYEHILVEAPSFEAACRRALDDIDEPWGNNAETDYESSGPTTIERAVEVPKSDEFDPDETSLSYLLYEAGLEPLPIPAEFADGQDKFIGRVGFV